MGKYLDILLAFKNEYFFKANTENSLFNCYFNRKSLTYTYSLYVQSVNFLSGYITVRKKPFKIEWLSNKVVLRS
jgi:hypothetical protein